MISSPMKVVFIDSMGSDLSVVNAARVSFEKESFWIDADEFEGSSCLPQEDVRLISYLAKHQHTSPFNHCFATFRVKAPIFVARQLVKHKFLPWNEVSRRYVDSDPEFYFPEFYREKAANVKQGSSEESSTYPLRSAREIARDCLLEYRYRLSLGVCPEQARDCLPLNTHTEWIWSGSLGAFADMCRLRLDSHAQAETREIAQRISEEMLKIYPVSWAALMNIGKTK